MGDNKSKREILNLRGHSVRLGIEAKDENGRPIDIEVQRADRVVAETGKPLGDGTHIIYVNASYLDDSPIGKLMYDFSCKKAADMHYKVLADKVRYYKEDAKGVEAMCQIMEDLIADEKKEMFIKMKASGKLSDEEIAGITGFTVEQVETVIKEAGIPIE